jgi:predicted transcriptional regulator
MVRQALALAGGSLSGAARLLGVTRQAVQQFVREALDE